MYTTTYSGVFSGNNVSPAFPQYTAFTLSSNIELSWPLGFQNLNMVVSVNMDITPTLGGCTVKMPDATGAGNGFAFEINNPGGFSFSLIDNSGALILNIAAGTARKIWLIDNSTVAGTWRTFLSGGGGASVTSVNATSDSDNLVIAGVPIIGAGTINFTLAKDLLALTSFVAGAGIAVRTAADTWVLRSIAGTVGQISVVNPSGIAGNITLSLSPVLDNLTSIGVGNLSLSANTIASTNANGAIIISPQGTGKIQLAKDTELLAGASLKFVSSGSANYTTLRNGTTIVNQNLILPTTTPADGQILGHSTLGQLAWYSVPTTGGGTTVIDSVARYSNTGGGLKDSILIISDAGAATGLTSLRVGNLSFGTLSTTTVTTVGLNEDFTVEPNGSGKLVTKSDIVVRRSLAAQSKIMLYNSANNFYAGIMANPGMVNNYTWTLPAVGGTEGYFVTDAANTMSLRPLPTPAVTVINIVPKFTDTVGTLGASLLSIDAAGAASGLTSHNTAGTFTLSATNTITITNAGTLVLGGASNTIITLGGNNASTVNIGGATNAGISLTSAATTTVTTPTLSLPTATASTTPTTGALTVAGGLGVALKAYIAGKTIIGAVPGVAHTQEQMLTLRGTGNNASNGPHYSAYVGTDAYPVFQNLNFSQSNVYLSFSSYYDGVWRSSYATSNFQIAKEASELLFKTATGYAPGTTPAWITAGSIDTTGLLQWQKTIKVFDVTDSTSSVTGSLQCLGGAGIAKRLNVGTQLAIGTLAGSRAPLSALEVAGAAGGGLNITDGAAGVSVKQFSLYYDTVNNRSVLSSYQQGAGATDMYITCSSLGINGVSFGSGVGVIAIANCTTAPTALPVGGGILFVEGGYLKYKGSITGVVTTIAPA